MSLNEGKFIFSRIILSAAVFISLSVETNGESRRCYWCGPLAEQVHRSQRAPACTGPREVTVCDPGYTHCATVATAPPYMESRYCVKLYQDECYPLFCNSTRTWRMTCPCRGDLCNGHKTDRELEAFIVLSKLVATAQNNRIKREITPTGHLVENKETIDVIETFDNVTNIETVEDLANIVSKINSTNSLAESEDNVMKENALNDTLSLTYEVLTGIPEPDNDVVTTEIVENQESAVLQKPIVALLDTKSNDVAGKSKIRSDSPAANIESNYHQTEIILMSSETTDVNMINPTDSPVNVLTTQTIRSESKPMVETTTVATKIDSPNIANKGKDNHPPAEALQQTEMPAVKPTEATRTTTTPSRTTHKVASTQHTMPATTGKPQNNTAVRLDVHLVVLFIGVILH